jgi:hypothetical protein
MQIYNRPAEIEVDVYGEPYQHFHIIKETVVQGELRRENLTLGTTHIFTRAGGYSGDD